MNSSVNKIINLTVQQTPKAIWANDPDQEEFDRRIKLQKEQENLSVILSSQYSICYTLL